MPVVLHVLYGFGFGKRRIPVFKIKCLEIVKSINVPPFWQDMEPRICFFQDIQSLFEYFRGAPDNPVKNLLEGTRLP